MFDLAGKRVWVAGHKGMVGSAIVRRLASEDCDVLTVDRTELDLTDQRGVLGWIVSILVALVGGEKMPTITGPSAQQSHSGDGLQQAAGCRVANLHHAFAVDNGRASERLSVRIPGQGVDEARRRTNKATDEG